MEHKDNRMKGAGAGGLINWIFGTVIGLAIFGSAIGAGLLQIMQPNSTGTNTTLFGTGGVALLGLTGLIIAASVILKVYHSSKVGG
jgi:hypothetical protein